MFLADMANWSRSRLGLAGRIAVVVTAVVLVSLVIAACGDSGGTTGTTEGTTVAGGSGASVQVVMLDRAYDPATVTIKVGDTVTWTNQDAPRHDVVADDGEFKSELFDKGETFSHTFTKAGTYPYHCTIHPGMDGTVIVE